MFVVEVKLRLKRRQQLHVVASASPLDYNSYFFVAGAGVLEASTICLLLFLSSPFTSSHPDLAL